MFGKSEVCGNLSNLGLLWYHWAWLLSECLFCLYSNYAVWYDVSWAAARGPFTYIIDGTELVFFHVNCAEMMRDVQGA